MRFAPFLAIVLAVAALSSAAAGAVGGEARVVYRTVHLSNLRRPPELYSIEASGRGRRLLARGVEQPAWSPDHRRIAFAGAIGGNEGIWVMNADGTSKRRLTTRVGDGDPTWSPDGRRIAYRSSRQGGFDLWVVPAAGGKPRPLLQTPRAVEVDPSWSPDGRRMAFQSTRGGQPQVWVMTLASRVARRVSGARDGFSPDWSPDGRRIAFMTGGRIATVNADGRGLKVLPSGTPRSADDPAWSPDGRRIAFQRGGQVLTMRATGGDRRYVTRAGWGTNGEPDW